MAEISTNHRAGCAVVQKMGRFGLPVSGARFVPIAAEHEGVLAHG